MNIFILDPDPKISASYYVDKHVPKIILEITQMLCSAIHNIGLSTLYRPIHINHPLVKWVGASKNNFEWAINMAYMLEEERIYRWGGNKIHKSIEVIENIKDYNRFFYNKNNNKIITPHVLCMPEKYKTEDVYDSYRNYYKYGKKHLHKWTKREIPKWIK